ncbi:hypothetical protein DFJ63DRAFT_332685 [Scheffersomyces coipomensis]|uniref:uncharacterized protein n=1 Tax=Scheffersomyces coipomensis TaxID=1788519 RepID=UPI00315CE6A9
MHSISSISQVLEENDTSGALIEISEETVHTADVSVKLESINQDLVTVSPDGNEAEEEIPKPKVSIIPYMPGKPNAGWYMEFRNNKQFWESLMTNWKTRVFVSKIARKDYYSCKWFKTTKAIRERHQMGYALPLFATTQPWISFNQFFTVHKYFVNEATFLQHGFREKKDQFVFCKVRWYLRLGYITYVLSFSPDPDDITKNFEITMYKVGYNFDYEYNKIFYRWSKSVGINYRYYLTKLKDNEKSLAHIYDKINHNIDIPEVIENPSTEQVHQKTLDFICKQVIFKAPPEAIGYLDDAYRYGDENAILNIHADKFSCNIDRQSIFSVDLEISVHVCTSLVLKKIEEFIGADRARERREYSPHR